MRSKSVIALGLLNVLLLANLCFHNVFSRPASAQVRGARASEYLMISGELPGFPGGVIFILDTRNKALSVRTFDGKKFQDMPAIDLGRILK